MYCSLLAIIRCCLDEQGPAPTLCRTTGDVQRDAEGRMGVRGRTRAVGDLSLQIGTAETFPNRMWLWFLTSFHSQLSDRFLLRWHLLHNNAWKRGTAPKWGSWCPTCQTVSVTSPPPPHHCDSTALTATFTTTKLKPEPCKWGDAPP